MPRFTITSHMLVKLAPATLALLLLAVQATPAAACGSLLAPNGAIRLSRAPRWSTGTTASNAT